MRRNIFYKVIVILVFVISVSVSYVYTTNSWEDLVHGIELKIEKLKLDYGPGFSY